MEFLDRFVFAHRRLLAAAFAGIAVVLALASMGSNDAGEHVVVAAADLDSATALAPHHLEVVRLPADVVPQASSADPDTLVGQVLAGPVRAGEVLTDRRILAPNDLDGYDIENASLASVRLTDPGVLNVVQVGDRVDVVAVDPHGHEATQVLARGAIVAMVPPPDEGSTSGQPVGIVTDNDSAIAIASAGLAMALTLVTH